MARNPLKVVNTHEAKTQLSSLMREVELRGVTIQICRNGTPVVELRPVAKTKARTIKKYSKISGVKLFEDPTSPIDPADWPEEFR